MAECCTSSDPGRPDKRKYIPFVLIPFAVVVYIFLERGVNFFVDHILKLNKSAHLTEAIRFFLYDTPKVLILLTVIVFVVGIIRSYFSPEKTRKALEGKPLFLGNIMAASLGIVTPFCTCSAIPLFIGFVESGIPLGVTFSFLVAAPMINEVALVLLFGLFGWKTALLYASTGWLIAILSGWAIGRLKVERFVEEWVYEIKTGDFQMEEAPLTFHDRIQAGYTAVVDIVSKVWIYIVAGIAVGAAVHGYVPENFMASIMGKDVWWSVPLAVAIGVPLYSNAAGIIPILQALLEKGAALGTALAFMMAVIGLSLPEMIILKKVIKLPLIAIFIGVVATGIMIVGFLFNWIY
ncbi:MAG: permease [Deltaproteobacteria bacterium]|nr:permease [Deltaproteobacteria bacterium]